MLKRPSKALFIVFVINFFLFIIDFRKIKKGTSIYFLFLLVFLVQCSSKPCVPEIFLKNKSHRVIEIYRPDGTKQCGMGEEISLESMEKELNSIGVETLDRRKGQNNLFRTVVCGAPTGKVNIYKIYSSDLKRVEPLSFKLLTIK